MKKITLYALAFCMSLVSSQLFAQAVTACNNVTAPEVENGTYTTEEIGGVIWTPAPPMAVTAAGLTHTEYLIVKVGTCALDSARVNCDTTGGGGDVILGTSTNGMFDPGNVSRYGINITAGDTFAVVAVGYNLAQIKTLVNDIFTGTTPAPAPCCSIFLLVGAPGFCDTLNANGINSQNDVTGLNDILTVFDAVASPQLSVESLVSYMQLVNSNASTFASNGCGSLTDGNLVCYGMNPNARYKYIASPTVSVEQVALLVDGLSIFPNPTNGDATIRFSVESASDMTINIYNSLGARVSHQNLGMVEGEQVLTAPTSGLAAGLYLVELTDGRNKLTSKLVVR